MPTARELMSALLDYIVEQAKRVDPRGFNLAKAKSLVLHPSELNSIPGLSFDLKLEGDHVWLRIDRLEAIAAPSLPPMLAGLMSIAADPHSAAPAVSGRALDAHLLSIEQPEAARARLLVMSDDYLRRWKLWAETEKPRRASIKIYGDLFALKHQIEAEETANPQELVWGIGIATWKLREGDDVVVFDYPLLTQAVEIAIDPKSMALSIRPRSTDTRLELDAFIACGVQGASEVERTIREHLARPEHSVTPFDASTYSGLLKTAATNLDANGTYREVLANGTTYAPPSDHLMVSDAWVLVARLRSNNYLIEDIKRLKSKVEAGAELPAGPLSLVSPPSDEPLQHNPVQFRGLCGSDAGTSANAEELYFPLPYNDEQVTIIKRLETSAGVTVQGPPGTGKTHTIANVICHYLATGRRVLITSRGEPALAVLQGKIPPEVRPLTVALLASDREGVRQFQASIEAIQHQVSQLDTGATQTAIDHIRHAIGQVHHDLSALDQRVDEIAKNHLSDVVIDGIVMRAYEVAKLVMSGGSEHDWFDDELNLSLAHVPPLTDTEVSEVRAARRRLGTDIAYMGALLPSADELPSVSQLSELHEALTGIHAIEQALDAMPAYALRATSIEVLLSAEQLLDHVKETLILLAEVETTAGGWAVLLREKCRASSFQSERQALEAMFLDIETLSQERAEFLQRPVVFPTAGLDNVRVLEAVERAAETGKPFGWMSFGAGEIKLLLASVRVAGFPPSDSNAWTHVLRFIRLHHRLVSFVSRWNTVAAELGMPELNGDIEDLRRIEGVAQSARKAHRIATVLDRRTLEMAEVVFISAPAVSLTGSSSALGKVQGALRQHLAKAGLVKAAVARTRLDESLAGKTGKIADELRLFVARELGHPGQTDGVTASRYAELIAELRRVAALSKALSIVEMAAARFRESGAVKWAERMTTVPASSSGEDGVVPSSWRKSWTWSRMRGHMDSIEARTELRTLAAKRGDLVNALGRRYIELVSKSAWLNAKRKATPKVLQALAGYATAIRRIGQGTGTNAMRHRRDAREAMTDAAGAVPCWIMSHARISETIPAEIGAFDLVIVDEASQSDLWALPAVLRGKKVLVVGDDKQVSPDGAFISGQFIETLRTRFLENQPYAASMTPEKSLYDLAARVFAGQQVMLREHFRCVAPIIAYSNSMFYKGAIQPLRIPLASERLDPPLVDIFVHGGYRTKHGTNPLEAEAIADEIEAIVSNPSLSGRSLGVVSLLGIEQAKYIDERVRERCSPAELMLRRFECGDARTFQGSERDIMFLSLVADRDQHHALSGNTYDQRFNVAASRARDRMYLVRSVEASTLSDVDLRRTLIDHFEKPQVGDLTPAADLISLCDSGFEREVFGMLVAAGYRVIPQVKVGAFKIDLVVEGGEDRRLAIELDGDEFHGPERWRHDMSRQRILERAGWKFWRCFASTWSLNKTDVFGELLFLLKTMGIEPVGALERVPTLVERREWRREPLVTPVTESTSTPA